MTIFGRLRRIVGREAMQKPLSIVRARLDRASSAPAALQHAIGGEFDAFGKIELAMLKFYSLKAQDYVIDVGCGAGRLAKPLASYLDGAYLGTDIEARRLRYARHIVRRPKWRFKIVRGYQIPERDSVADFVCFFSVLTHVNAEAAYLYLEEAKRVLKPGGTILFSFLEFALDSHWCIFSSGVEQERAQKPKSPNYFISRDAISAWAKNLGLAVEDLRSGLDRFVPLDAPVRLDSGEEMRDAGNLGQSICVLRKPQDT